MEQKHIIEEKLLSSFAHIEKGTNDYNDKVRLYNALSNRETKGLKAETLNEIKAVAKTMYGWLDFKEKKAIDEELQQLELSVKWRDEQIEKQVKHLLKTDLKACLVNKTEEQIKEFKESLKQAIASKY